MASTYNVLHAVPDTPKSSALSPPGKTLFPAGSSVISPDDAIILKPASFVIVSAVKTNPSIVKSVVASIVVPLIVVCVD